MLNYLHLVSVKNEVWQIDFLLRLRKRSCFYFVIKKPKQDFEKRIFCSITILLCVLFADIMMKI